MELVLVLLVEAALPFVDLVGVAGELAPAAEPVLDAVLVLVGNVAPSVVEPALRAVVELVVGVGLALGYVDPSAAVLVHHAAAVELALVVAELVLAECVVVELALGHVAAFVAELEHHAAAVPVDFCLE